MGKRKRGSLDVIPVFLDGTYMRAKAGWLSSRRYLSVRDQYCALTVLGFCYSILSAISQSQSEDFRKKEENECLSDRCREV